MNPHRQSRRRLIVDTAVSLFAELSYHGTTMDALSHETGVNKATIYYYFSTKRDILFEICVSTVAEHLAVVKKASQIKDPTQALHFMIDTTVRHVATNREICRVYYQEEDYFSQIFSRTQFQTIKQQRIEFAEHLQAVIERGVSCGQFKTMNVTICTRLINTLILAPLRWTESDADILAAAKDMRELIANGMISSNGLAIVRNGPS